MKATMLFLAWVGCLPKGAYQLQPLAAGPGMSGTLQYSAAAALDSTPGMGIDLAVQLSAENRGESTIRVDLTRARISIDGQPFLSCRYGSGADPKKLVSNIQAGEKAYLNVTCRDIARPIHTAELKFMTSGTGGSGEISVGWVGLGERP